MCSVLHAGQFAAPLEVAPIALAHGKLPDHNDEHKPDHSALAEMTMSKSAEGFPPAHNIHSWATASWRSSMVNLLQTTQCHPSHHTTFEKRNGREAQEKTIRTTGQHQAKAQSSQESGISKEWKEARQANQRPPELGRLQMLVCR